ncbi:GDSL-type esterase/lipase family protein [Corynebacterium pilosum]|uniref:Hydrolase domain-containing protein n=1 Tax=Corynebacterium pilosum TaxID=35756 RepID=A0A376CLU7_9CORY|nr:GDSL-type esterase/lipase family protein [Corynebacterium pilosum]STC69471.1 Hydrolase domain-containing protein [Corynebacterium pilosum]
MLIHATRRKVTALVASIAATMLAAITMVAGPAVPSAQAQNGNMVIFGDSWVADPPLEQWAAGKLGLDARGSSNVTTWCPTSNNNFGKVAARQLGLAAHDYSCTGTVTISQGPKLASQVNRAIDSRGLNHDTRRVLISVGFNDTYNNDGRPHADVRRDFVNYMRPQVDRIRAHAPNARIQFVGYPQISDGRGNVCLFHVGPNMHDVTPLAKITEWENLGQWMLVDAARATGTQFVDLKPATRNNHMCAPDHLRMWPGVVDFYAGGGNMPFHFTQRGHNYVGGIVARS